MQFKYHSQRVARCVVGLRPTTPGASGADSSVELAQGAAWARAVQVNACLRLPFWACLPPSARQRCNVQLLEAAQEAPGDAGPRRELAPQTVFRVHAAPAPVHAPAPSSLPPPSSGVLQLAPEAPWVVGAGPLPMARTKITPKRKRASETYAITQLYGLAPCTALGTIAFLVQWSTGEIGWIPYEMLGSTLAECTELAVALVRSAVMLGNDIPNDFDGDVHVFSDVAEYYAKSIAAGDGGAIGVTDESQFDGLPGPVWNVSEADLKAIESMKIFLHIAEIKEIEDKLLVEDDVSLEDESEEQRKRSEKYLKKQAAAKGKGKVLNLLSLDEILGVTKQATTDSDTAIMPTPKSAAKTIASPSPASKPKASSANKVKHTLAFKNAMKKSSKRKSVTPRKKTKN